MNSENQRACALREIEEEVPEEGASGRASASNDACKTKRTAAAEFPPGERRARHRRKQAMHLRTVVGTVELTVWQGPDPRDPHGGIPIREAWGCRRINR